MNHRNYLTALHMQYVMHGNIGDWCSRAGWGQIVLAANRNGGMLRLIASRHDDDDDDYIWLNESKMQAAHCASSGTVCKGKVLLVSTNDVNKQYVATAMLLFYFTKIVEKSTVWSYSLGLLCRSEWCDDVQPASGRCSYMMKSTGWLDSVSVTQVICVLLCILIIIPFRSCCDGNGVTAIGKFSKVPGKLHWCWGYVNVFACLAGMGKTRFFWQSF